MKNKPQPPKAPPAKMARPEIRYEEKPSERVKDSPPQEPEKNRSDYHGIDSAPRNGVLIVLSETGKDKGEVGFWKKTRAFANATQKWEETWFFVSNTTNLKLSFKPKFWRARVAYEV